ncbi:Dual specificity phosphatase [Brachionus plicatilis]|uniref:Dual specificity phosphatase n=1 Tax=Brachionus plicatilis TaxID=10195 RepID=A0A3M7QJ24_BRAPC|nr:Dual specificity phosphatase [Brachionus plicatilis]
MNNSLNKPSTCRLINVAPCNANDDSDHESPGPQAANLSRNSMVSGRASSFESSLSLDTTSEVLSRPVTARSLPIPARPKPPSINVIKSPSSDSKNTEPSTIKHSSSSPVLIKPRKNSACSKTNLDTYLDYSMSPFTTKFELIGKKSYYKTSMRKCHSSTHLSEEKMVAPGQFGTSEASFVQITNDLFCGNLSLVKNERQMCKMNVEYLIDMTNMRPDELGRRTLGKIPCTCLKQHSRIHINVEIKQTDFKSLFKSFCEVNRFIQKSRKSTTTRRVLIFGKSTYSAQVVCAAAQYLMLEYDMGVEMALKSVTKVKLDFVNTKIDECYRKYLEDFEKYLDHMSGRVFGKLDYGGGAENKNERSLKAKRDMFEENFEFFDDNEVEDFGQFENSCRSRSSMTNLTDSEDKKRSRRKKKESKENCKLKIAWM